jgi:CTP synthase
VGDIESGPFIEAMRQFQFRVGTENFLNIHVTFVPMLGVVGEQKTKPTQQSVRTLRSLGLSPDVIVCRSASPLTASTKRKIASFCHVSSNAVVGIHDVSNLYRVPLMLEQQGLPHLLLSRFQLLFKDGTPRETNLADWQKLAEMADLAARGEVVRIALVGKYTGLSDSYLSVIKALQHSCISLQRKLVINWITASSLETENSSQTNNTAPVKKSSEQEEEDDEETPKEQTYEEAWSLLKEAHGILVPGGFGDRGVEGKIIAAKYARENNIPYLGVCLGMQLAVIEVARNVLGRHKATSEEFDPKTDSAAIVYMPEISKTHLGGTMRLGKRTTILNTTDCLAAKVYRGSTLVDERHRHRYEVNPGWVEAIEKGSTLRFVGRDETGQRMEIAELLDHPFFLGTQYHPEFLSRPGKPSPPFLGFVAASAGVFESKFNPATSS